MVLAATSSVSRTWAGRPFSAEAAAEVALISEVLGAQAPGSGQALGKGQLVSREGARVQTWDRTDSARPTVGVHALTKLALNGLTAKLAKDLRPDRILVNSGCPGFAEYGARPVPEGAASFVWAATLPDDGPSGGFFQGGQPLGW